jgi:crotonobetainyl-CoA:carnitine CoA-transferase CaiB-like acyl-CoA transferase
VGPFTGGDEHLERGVLFLWLNTSKRSVCIDMDTPEGEALVQRLLAKADVLVLSGQEQRFDADALSKQFEQLVVTRVTPFGVIGAHAGWKAEQITLLAMSGWMNTTGKPDREPLACGSLFPETAPGLAAASATLMAVNARKQTGRGQVVDVSQQEVLIHMQPYSTVGYAYSGVERARNGMPFPMTIVPAADGYLGINVLTQPQWEALCGFTEQLDLLADERFGSPSERAPHAAELTHRFAQWANDKPKAETFAAGQAWRVPLGFVPHTSEVRDLEPHIARDFFAVVEHPEAGAVPLPAPPYLFDGQRPPASRAPLLGEHTKEFADTHGMEGLP